MAKFFLILFVVFVVVYPFLLLLLVMLLRLVRGSLPRQITHVSDKHRVREREREREQGKMPKRNVFNIFIGLSSRSLALFRVFLWLDFKQFFLLLSAEL